jgi:hypothetical protein
MAVNTKAARARATQASRRAADLRSNPYIQRVLEDPEVRDSVRAALESTRKAYKRLNNGRGPTKALMEDKKLQRELRTASNHLRTAAEHVRTPRKRRRPLRKLLGIAIIGGILVLIVNEVARNALLDRIFGAEEEFTYTSTTSPPVTAGTPG